METITNYIAENKQRFLDELFDFIRIPSVSAKEEHNADMGRAAEYVKHSLLAAGADNAEVIPTHGHPVVYGEKIINASLPTVLIYGHYDVQPTGDLNLWTSPPFEPEIRDGKIWARGADDDKGQLFIQVKAFELLNRTNTLNCNVKFMIEGEEEVGSKHLGDFCIANKDRLKADIILVSDTSFLAADVPSLTTGLRGLSYVEVEVTGPNRDLHSGLYGGAVANPANVLAKMIASLTDDKGKITVKGFYDAVLESSAEERAEMAKAPFDIDDYCKKIGIKKEFGEEGYSTMERSGSRPTLDVNGMWSGYTEKGAKTIIPSKAYAKISMRLVPNQDSKVITQLFQEHFEAIAPETVSVTVTDLHGGEGYVCPIEIPAYKAASRAMETTYGKKPVPYRSGGSIPIISLFERVLGIKTILMGFGLDSDAIHSPNENFPLENFFKGIETVPLFYQFYIEELNKA